MKYNAPTYPLRVSYSCLGQHARLLHSNGAREATGKCKMAPVFNPEGVETRIVHRLVDFLGKDILEVGCGDGRLTLRYADQAASVLAIDPKENKIALAREHTPEHLRSSVTFQTTDIASLNAPEASFDVAILSWSIQ